MSRYYFACLASIKITIAVHFVCLSNESEKQQQQQQNNSDWRICIAD